MDQQIHIRIPIEDHKKAKAIAAANGQSFNDFIANAIADYLKNFEFSVTDKNSSRQKESTTNAI